MRCWHLSIFQPACCHHGGVHCYASCQVTARSSWTLLLVALRWLCHIASLARVAPLVSILIPARAQRLICHGSNLGLCFSFSSSFPSVWGGAWRLSCCSCGLGGWWRGETRGSGSALAANSAQDQVRSRHSVVRLRTLYSPPWDHPRARSSACIGHGAQSNPVGLRHRRRRRWHYVSGQLLAAVAIEWKGSRRATAEHSRSRNATTWAGLLEACSRQLNAQLRQLWIWWHHCTGLYPTRCWRMHVFAGVRHAPWVAYRTGLHCWHWLTADRAIGQISASFLPYRLQHTVVRGPWL